MILKVRYYLFFFLIASQFFFTCKSAPAETPVPGAMGQPVTGEGRQVSGGLAEEIRNLIETGILSSMVQALEIIRSRDLGGIDFGRMMNGIITVFVRLVYSDSMVRLPAFDPPPTNNYTRIIREAEKGNYIRPPENSTDFFEYVLPFLSLKNETPPEILAEVINDLEKAAELRPLSVLPPYFRGLVYERSGQLDDAAAAFNHAYEISSECYPALAGLARIMRLSGRKEETILFFSDLMIRYPDNTGIKRQLAMTYYENGDWSMARPMADEILQNNPRDGEFILMKAHLLIEQGVFTQAQALLDTYASINPNDRLYLFLRARVQAEGNRNRDSALNYLRSIIRTNPDDEEVLTYAAELLTESQRPADQAEGREYLKHLQQKPESPVTVLGLSLRDAVRRESWLEAQGFLNRILALRRSVQDLIDGYQVERALGNRTRALSYARELYDRDTSSNDYIAVYVSALIDSGRREEASRLLESRLAALSSGTARGKFYFLRSRIQANEEAALSDLRSSLFEDPRNLDALIAMFEIYHQRREERRAVYYLKQAIAIAGDDPRIKRYEREYAALLGKP